MSEPEVSRVLWRTSTHSSANGECVEVATITWRTTEPLCDRGSSLGRTGRRYGVRRFGPRNRNVASRIESRPSMTIRTRPSPMPRPPCGGQP